MDLGVHGEALHVDNQVPRELQQPAPTPPRPARVSAPRGGGRRPARRRGGGEGRRGRGGDRKRLSIPRMFCSATPLNFWRMVWSGTCTADAHRE
jgi:hypothetical protein